MHRRKGAIQEFKFRQLIESNYSWRQCIQNVEINFIQNAIPNALLFIDEPDSLNSPTV